MTSMKPSDHLEGDEAMAAVRLDEAQEQTLANLARSTGRLKSYYIREAPVLYLEDRADSLAGLAAMERDEETYSSSEARRRLHLAG